MWVVGLVFGEGYVGSGVSFRGRVCGWLCRNTINPNILTANSLF